MARPTPTKTAPPPASVVPDEQSNALLAVLFDAFFMAGKPKRE
jgi:hypothetical protein